ncbi:MAG: GTP cyclohydrolase I FolE [Deltaproteobacteria bacterium]|nr:GTP cyclohydrolase I FolE [Deltaproteobacteria bacterium]
MIPKDTAEAAVEVFLRGLGVPLDADPELRETPARVARVWKEELLDGYRKDPARCLGEPLPSRATGMVLLRGLTYTSVCPHHLLTVEGVAHLAYVPDGRIVGLGALVTLLEALAHRLVLQETLGEQLAGSLVEHLGARAAGAVLEARHGCLSQRGERQTGATVVTHAFAGRWAAHPDERAEFLGAVAR